MSSTDTQAAAPPPATLTPQQITELMQEGREVSDFFDEGFVNDVTSNEIIRAILGKNYDNAILTQIVVHNVPYNFVPVNHKISDAECKCRADLWTVLDKRTAQQGIPVTGVTDIAKIRVRLQAVRKLIMAMAKPKLQAHFKKLFRRIFGGKLTFLNGTRRVDTIDEICEYLRQGSWDNQKRHLAFMVLHGFWEKANNPLVEIVNEICHLLRWNLVKVSAEGTNVVRNHKGGTIKSLVVKQKNTILDKVKNIIKTTHLEGVLVRQMTVRNEPYVVVNVSKKDPYKVVRVVRSFDNTFGFPGYLALYKGHPLHDVMSLEEKNAKSARDAEAAAENKKNSGDEMEPEAILGYVQSLLEGGNIKSKEQLLQELASQCGRKVGQIGDEAEKEGASLLDSLLEGNDISSLGWDNDPFALDLHTPLSHTRAPPTPPEAYNGFVAEKHPSPQQPRSPQQEPTAASQPTPSPPTQAATRTEPTPPAATQTVQVPQETEAVLRTPQIAPRTVAQPKETPVVRSSPRKQPNTPNRTSPRKQQSPTKVPESPAKVPEDEAAALARAPECNHKALAQFQSLGGAYFEKYSQANFPTNCSGCSKTFVGKLPRGVELDTCTQVKVTNGKPAMCCPNANLSSYHKCVYCFCDSCYKTAVAKAADSSDEQVGRSGRKRKQRS